MIYLQAPERKLSQMISYLSNDKLSTQTLYIQLRAIEACSVIYNLISGVDSSITRINSTALPLFKEGIAFLSLPRETYYLFHFYLKHCTVNLNIYTASASIISIADLTASTILGLNFIKKISHFQDLQGITLPLPPIYYKALLIRSVAKIAFNLLGVFEIATNNRRFKREKSIDNAFDFGVNICSTIYSGAVLNGSSSESIKGIWAGASLFSWGKYAFKVLYLGRSVNVYMDTQYNTIL